MTLVYVPGLPRLVVEDYLKRYYQASPPQGGRLDLILGRGDLSQLPGVAQVGQRFALAFDPLYWGEIAPTLAQNYPETSAPLLSLMLPRPEPVFTLRGQTYPGPQVMGILNLTPDSFYDGGKYTQLDQALAQAERMIEEGAHWLDLGGESTRPGSDPVEAPEEIKRVLPTLKAIQKRWPQIPLSIDTQKTEVARAALDAGACLVNDVSGLAAGSEMAQLVAEYGAGYVLMHRQGTPKSMQNSPFYEDPVLEVTEHFEQKLRQMEAAGVPKQAILLDPGIGFGKLKTHNLDLLRMTEAFFHLGAAILLGTSNKSFIGQTLGFGPEDRLFPSLATQCLGFERGASFFRVHEVGPTLKALKMTYFYKKP